MPEFLDIVSVVTERDGIEAAFRRFAAHQRSEAVFRQHLADRAQPVGTFRMSRRRQMVETGGMGQKKRHARSWHIRCAYRGRANLGGHRPLGKSRACGYGLAAQLSRTM